MIIVLDPVSPRILKGSGTKDMIQTLNVNVTIGQDVTVLYGAQVYIKCPFKAVPQGTVIWSGTDDVALEARRAIEVDDGKALLISKATKESGAMYQCIVSNIFGSDVAKTTVTVTGTSISKIYDSLLHFKSTFVVAIASKHLVEGSHSVVE